MPDDKQDLHQENYSLDDILREVSSWSEPEDTAKIPSDLASPQEPEATPIPTDDETSPQVEEEAGSAPQEPEPVAKTEPKESATVEHSKAPAEAPVPSESSTQVVAPSQETNDPQTTQASESPEENQAEEEAITPPDNLIPLYPEQESKTAEKEPETIRELLVLGSKRVQRFYHGHKEQFSPDTLKPKLKSKLPKTIKKPKKPTLHIPLPKLPDLPTPPDTPAKELAQRYAKGLSSLRLQYRAVFFLTALLLALAFLHSTTLVPLPSFLKDTVNMSWISLAVFFLALCCSGAILIDGLRSVLLAQLRMETAASLACSLVLIDALTMLLLGLRPSSLPLFAPASLVLAFQLWGHYWKRETLRQTCRTASMASAPDVMTVEPSQWNGKAVYRRRFGSLTSFGRQVQQEDGAERHFRLWLPILLIGSLLLSLLVTVGNKQPQLFFWSFSATLIAACTLNGCLCFSLPFRGLCRRLSKLGVALAGWKGTQSAASGNGLLIDDTDLFPPGAIQLDSYELYDDFAAEEVLSVTASLIRASGSGLDELFFNLLRTDCGRYLTVTELETENEGISAHVAGETVFVGNISFLERMGIEIPIGVRVKTGVFCAINHRFAGHFVLDYHLHKSFPPSMDALISNRITPVLIALDFNLVPSVLKRLFRFPWDKMAFPDLSQRAKLLHSPMPKESTLMAALCLEGLTPLAAAAAGAQRLQRAVQLCSTLSCLGSVIGILLAIYLSAAAAVTALSALSLSLFLLSWFLPIYLISGWVNQF